MGRFQEMINANKLSIVVSLPENDLTLTEAAIAAGAHGVKFHINVQHRASGNTFHDLNTYRELFLQVRREFDGPLGIVLGDCSEKILTEEVKEAEQLGFDYFSLYSKHIPLSLLKTERLAKTFAIADDFNFNLLDNFDSSMMDGFEVSTVAKEDYGKKLTFEDLLTFQHAIQKVNNIPIIIPSQKKWVPEDVAHLYNIGANVLMLGAVVIGSTEETIYNEVKKFREAVDAL